MTKYALFQKNILFQNLTEEDFNRMLETSVTMDVEEGNYFIREGDEAENFYFILSGDVTITKTDILNQEHIIAELKQGDTVGEISFIDRKPRSASAKAATHVKLLIISFNALEKLATSSPSFKHTLDHLSDVLGTHIRQTNLAVVSALGKQLEESRMRAGLGLLVLNIVIAISLFTFFLSWIATQTSNATATTFVSFPLTLGFVLLFYSIMKSSNLPLSTFGLTTNNWRKAVIESVLFSSLLCGLIVTVKWFLIASTTEYHSHKIFETYLSIHLQHDLYGINKNQMWWLIFFIYAVIITPLQELIVRGSLQGSLQVFLTNRFSILKAIIISNFMFSTSHLFISAEYSIAAFWAGIYLGWLFYRHGTLIGVIIAHAMLGIWTTMVVGF